MNTKESGIYPDIFPPADIAGFFGLSFHVPRYENVEFINDTTGQHTLRLISRFDDAYLPPGLDRNMMRRMLWIHDLPEVLTGDRSVVVKEADSLLNGQALHKERLAALDIFRNGNYPEAAQDYALWQAFDEAGEALKGRIEPGMSISPVAVVAKIFDMIDGNTFFHRHFADWIAGSGYSQLSFPDSNTVKYTLKHYLSVSKNLDRIGLPDDIREFSLELLQQEMQEIVACWENVPAAIYARLPLEIRQVLNQIRNSILHIVT